MEKAVDLLGALQSAYDEISTLKLRMTSAEERLSRLEDNKVETKEKVSRLERLTLRRQSVELSEPGSPVNKSTRS
jgi:predicted  nucleic acid-binding Zn-ribbon protein